MAHKLSIEAVHKHTSDETHKLHNNQPHSHDSVQKSEKKIIIL